MAVSVAVLDANVLFGIETTDLFLTLATKRLIRVHWSVEILDEVRRNLAQRPGMPIEAIDYRIRHMNTALPDALRDVPAELSQEMPIDAKDQHVLALAVTVEATHLVTSNLRDFPAEICSGLGVEPIGPDEFASRIAHIDMPMVRAAIREMAERRRNPPLDQTQLTERLGSQLPALAETLRS